MKWNPIEPNKNLSKPSKIRIWIEHSRHEVTQTLTLRTESKDGLWPRTSREQIRTRLTLNKTAEQFLIIVHLCVWCFRESFPLPMKISWKQIKNTNKQYILDSRIVPSLWRCHNSEIDKLAALKIPLDYSTSP